MIAGITGPTTVLEEYKNGVNIAQPFVRTDLREYELKIDPRIKNLTSLAFEQLKEIMQNVNGIHSHVESHEPAKGYVLYLQVYAKNKRPIEVKIVAHGTREMNTPMPMPAVPAKGQEDCAFCKNTSSMPGYEDAANEYAHVMMSQEKNPLTISNAEEQKEVHYGHFFEMPLEKQISLVQAALKTIEIGAKNATRYWLICHIGTEGHQTFGHPHIHILRALGGEEKQI